MIEGLDNRKLQHYFPIIVNICAYHSHKNRQKQYVFHLHTFTT